MFFSHSKLDSSSASDAYAVESGLIYRPIPELKSLLVRSRNVYCFAWALGAFAVSLTVLHAMGQAGNLSGNGGFAGIGGYMGAVFYGIIALGAGQRTTWGRIGCLVISAILLAQAAWYISSPSHWNWNTASAVMLGRFLVGWVGMVSFLGTYELFGPHAVSHAILKDALEQARETRMEETALLKAQAEGLREARRSMGAAGATDSTVSKGSTDSAGSADPKGPTWAA